MCVCMGSIVGIGGDFVGRGWWNVVGESTTGGLGRCPHVRLYDCRL